MYKVFWKDKLVAIHEGELVRCLDKHLAPYALFANEDTVSIFDFIKWLESRVFQESRLDLDDLLKGLGLPDYNVLHIVDKTKAVLTGVDFYSVEWEDQYELKSGT